ALPARPRGRGRARPGGQAMGRRGRARAPGLGAEVPGRRLTRPPGRVAGLFRPETMALRGRPPRRRGGAGGSDPALGAYPATVAAGLTRVLGPALVGLYLHGSAAMGGWSPERSDV